MKPPSLTIGIEEEYQIIDPQTRELRSYITQILEDSRLILKEQVKAELHQSMVEVGTEVCRSPAEARAELVRLRREIMGLAGRNGLKIAAAGTHPFSSWVTQEITPFERYLGVKQDMQDLAQQLLIFGTHVHVAIEDRDFLIDAMNVARYFVPHVLCLSASSAVWLGRQAGRHGQAGRGAGARPDPRADRVVPGRRDRRIGDAEGNRVRLRDPKKRRQRGAAGGDVQPHQRPEGRGRPADRRDGRGRG